MVCYFQQWSPILNKVSLSSNIFEEDNKKQETSIKLFYSYFVWSRMGQGCQNIEWHIAEGAIWSERQK